MDKYVSSFYGKMNDVQDFKSIVKAYTKLYKNYLPENKKAKILDVGCGPGQFLTYLKGLGYKNVQGIDISEEQIKLCLQHKVKAEVADAALYLINHKNEFNLIVFNDVIEHIPKDELMDTLYATQVALKEKGSIIIKVPNMSNPFASYVRYIDFSHTIGFTEDSLYEVLSMSGFSNIKILPVEFSFEGRMWHNVQRFVISLMLKSFMMYRTPKVVSINMLAVGDK